MDAEQDESESARHQRWVEDDWLAESCESAQELRAMRLCARLADRVFTEIDGEGQVEWLAFRYDDALFYWNPDDGWDGESPLNIVVCRMANVADAADTGLEQVRESRDELSARVAKAEAQVAAVLGMAAYSVNTSHEYRPGHFASGVFLAPNMDAALAIATATLGGKVTGGHLLGAVRGIETDPERTRPK